MAAESIDVSSLVERIEDGRARLVDVRSPAEFEGMHVPGAYNVPLDRIEEYADELEQVEEDLVLVCRTGNRAGEAEDRLAARGVSRVRVLEGGMRAWRDRDGPVEQGRSRWRIERQVRFAAGMLVLVGVALGLLVDEAFYGLSAFVGGGLVFAGVTDTCAMGLLLARMPHNRQTDDGPSARDEIDRLLREASASTGGATNLSH